MTSNQETVAALRLMQESWKFHPLTCENDSRHPVLDPYESSDKSLHMRCTACPWDQLVPDYAIGMALQSFGPNARKS